MKIYLTILVFFTYQATFSQFAVIDDSDGFVNVRESPAISNNIIDTLLNGQIVYCFEPENDWYIVDYNLESKNRGAGYIHKSRFKFIDNYEKVPIINIHTDSVLFGLDTIHLKMTQKSFNPKAHKLQYHIGSKNEATYLKTIDGKTIWGSDGQIPKKQYGKALLQIGKKKINLPVENLYEPNLDHTLMTIDPKNDILFISAENSDAAGAYAVLWIIEKGMYKQRIITYPF